MRTLVQRVVVTILSTIFLAAAGAVGGYVLGHAFAIRQAAARLDHYAGSILLEGVTSSSESRAILATMNTSSYDFCSDTEIEYFRQLIFQSQFLKAAGRMRDGKIECSTTSGRSEIDRNAKHAHHCPQGWNKNLQEPSSISRRRSKRDLGATRRFIYRLQPLHHGFARSPAHAFH